MDTKKYQKSLNEYQWWCRRVGKPFKESKMSIDLEFAKWDILRTDEFDDGEWKQYEKSLKDKYENQSNSSSQ